jgi:hypothetical protein
MLRAFEFVNNSRLDDYHKISFDDDGDKFIVYGEELLSPLPTPKLEDHRLSFFRSCLFDIFAATLNSWRLFPHPQPEDAPCCGDRKPPNMPIVIVIS